MSVVAAIVASGLLSAGAKLFAADKAKDAQLKAVNQSNAAQLLMFGLNKEILKPYIKSGVKASGRLFNQIDKISSKPISFTQKDLEETPGYKFTLAQGLKSVQNSAAARGLGVSGAALKGATEYATGLASKTYNDRFQNELANRNFQLATRGAKIGALQGLVGVGGNAAAGLGGNAVQTGANIGSNIIGGGNATAGAAVSSANAFSDLGNDLVTALLAKNKLDFGGGSSTGVYN